MIFTAAATFLLAGTALAGTFAVPLLAGGLSLAASYGLSYAQKALSGEPHQDAPSQVYQGVQGELQAGGDIPRSFNLGYSVTGGSLVYANYWGESFPGGTRTPNAYLTQVIALADLPGGNLVEVWINGERCTLEGVLDPEGRGYPVVEYRKDGQPYVWIKYYDGTQTVADPFLVNTVSSFDRPYESTRVGVGVAYVIATSLVNDTLWSGFPTFKFAVSGIPLYDPTKDSTNGGVGPQRWSDPSTWGGDGDQLPAVQIYNLLRGIHFDGVWLYGLQRMTAARLPAINWNAQIAKCRATIQGAGGLEPMYRTGGQVFVSVPTVRTVEELLTGCQGRLSEIGGFYKIHLGAPDAPGFTITDDDILSSEEQNFAPFFGLADSINGIAATYPSPAEAWAMKPAPALYDADFEIEDGSRRLLSSPAFNFVPYPEQVQRLQKSALQEARRARRHSFTLPPAFWIVEPGDVFAYTSERNGYVEKLFRLDGVVDKGNLDVLVNLTEVDPTDYDWSHDDDYIPGATGPTVIPRPEPQGVVDWFAEPATVNDSGGSPRRPAIRISWDGDMPGVVGVQYEVRLATDHSHVTRGRTDQLAAGSLLISQSLLPAMDYQARGQYLPSAPRDMLWSDWLDVTTPGVKFSLADLDASIAHQVATIQDALNDRLDFIAQQVSAIVANQDSRNWLDKRELRSQLSARSDAAEARIEEVRTAAVDAGAAFASFSTVVTATFGSTTAFVSQTASAIATYDGWGAAQYAVTLNVDGNATGFNLVNGGAGTSAFTVVADKFQIQLPGYNGSSPVPVFTTGMIDGVPSIGISGNMFLDGTLNASKIVAGSINTTHLAVNSVDIANVIAGAMSNIDGTTGSIAASSSGTPISISFGVKGGKVLLICSIRLTSPAAIGGRAFLLKRDGTTIKTMIASSVIEDIATNGYADIVQTHLCLDLGVSDATHTYTVTAAAAPGAANLELFLFNPRR